LKLHEGATVIAAESHRGIIYIISVFDEGGKTQTEIGTYPSLKEYTTTNTEFVDEYKPLKNYAGGWADFTTDKYMMKTISITY
jgi:hypothetical protein